jgi:hypothetical protein
LPITLVKLYGETIKNDNILYWETATEFNNAGFELERSINGNNFSSIGSIPSKALDGNSNQNLKYNFVDKKALEGKSYYRVKQVDKDKKMSLSSIVALSKTSSKQLSVAAIFPNPVYDKLNIAIVSPSSQVVTIRMNDVNGKTISQKVVSLTTGSNNLNFDVKSLSSGQYFLNVTTVDGTQKQIVQKFTKQ